MPLALRLSRTAAVVALLLFLIAFSGKAEGHDENRIYASDENNLFHDDENFWSRFVEEVTSSSFTPPPTPPPTPGPTPEPTPGPTPEPSSSPTDFCETEVRTFSFF